MESAVELIKKMTYRSVTLATCESLTGGGLGAAITDVPGASAVFRGSLVTYARDLKTSLAGVDAELVDAEGVVNELTAIQMALGAQNQCEYNGGGRTHGDRRTEGRHSVVRRRRSQHGHVTATPVHGTEALRRRQAEHPPAVHRARTGNVPAGAVRPRHHREYRALVQRCAMWSGQWARRVVGGEQ